MESLPAEIIKGKTDSFAVPDLPLTRKPPVVRKSFADNPEFKMPIS
jgi:hypothetical protein